jgi:serine/threonine-protein kinase
MLGPPPDAGAVARSTAADRSLAMTAADRHLLFGLLALQNGLIDHGQLVAAFQAWTLDKSKSLADHLEARSDLTSARRGLVEALVRVHLETHGGDVERSLTAVSAGNSIRETLAELGDPDIEATLSHVASDHGSTDVFGAGRRSSRLPGAAAGDGHRFQILRPHARGGLGAVFVALDSELHREVALKQILDRHADDPTSRARFLLEAEVTGGLEHPGIVPVYGLGVYADGRPYYAMRLIKGESLKEAIEGFHRDEALRRDPGRRSLGLRKLLRRFLDVCNAVEYAHSRNVLHRDIKPSNVILGKHGETLVVDWGLAKVRDGAEAVFSDERPLVPHSASGSSETLPGSALGTPAYMSPEQARGDLEHLGPQSDVYSLGATLYCLLTGEPPFVGDAIDVIRRVECGAFSPPRSVVRSIDPALQAICLRAMALAPADRYPTPKALGEDVERWMADETVAAYRESWTRTLTRWLTRHRTGVTAVGAAMLVALAGLGAVLGVQAWANRQLTAKHAQLDAAFRREADARKEAENNFNMALKAVDDSLTSVSENTLFQLQDSVDIRGLRRELLNSALTYYKSFVNQRSQDPLLRRQLARAYFRVGQITQEVESPNRAIEAYRQAQAIWEPLAAARPVDHELQGDLGASYLAIGKLQDTAVNLDLGEAMKSLARARSILEPLAAANPLEPGYQSRLAECYSEIAIVQARHEQPAESLVLLQKAKTIEQDLISRYPDKHAYRKNLAEITNVLGYTCYKQRRNDEALASFREVQNICQTVSNQMTVGPKPLWLLNLLALSHANVASIHKERGELEAALESYGKSLVYQSALIDSHRSVIAYKVKFAASCRDLAEVQADAHQDVKALQTIRRSIDVLEGVVRAQPDQAGYHAELGLSWNYLGVLYDTARKNSEALPCFERAVAEQQLAVDKAKDVDGYRAFLANHLDNLGEQFLDFGRVAEGLPSFRRSLRIFRDLHAAHPGMRFYALGVLKSLIREGTIERHDGDAATAQQRFTEARVFLDRWAGAEPGDAALRVLLGATLDQEANTLFDQGFAEEARRRLERAIALLKPRPGRAASDQGSVEQSQSRHDVMYVLGLVSAAGEVGVEERGLCSEALWDLARVLRAQKRAADAATADDELAALWSRSPSSELVDLAFRQLERALVIGYGKTPLSDRARAVRELDLAQAADNLRLAFARGFHDLRKLGSHPDSTFLLSREDLPLLIMDMAFPDWPFADQ